MAQICLTVSLLTRALRIYERKGSKHLFFKSLNKICKQIGFKVELLGNDRGPSHFEDLFWEIFDEISHYTPYGHKKVYSTYQAAKYVGENDIPGAIVETGAYEGGCSILMAETLYEVGCTDRDVYLYDTFEGYPEPSELDQPIGQGQSAKNRYEAHTKNGDVDWWNSSLEEVQKRVQSSRYPTPRYKIVDGKIEETIPAKTPDEIAVLRLDTGWYESTKHELEQLYPRLSDNGVIIVNNYGYWDGCKRAIDEYFTQLETPPLLFSTVGDVRYAGIKPV